MDSKCNHVRSTQVVIVLCKVELVPVTYRPNDLVEDEAERNGSDNDEKNAGDKSHGTYQTEI